MCYVANNYTNVQMKSYSTNNMCRAPPSFLFMHLHEIYVPTFGLSPEPTAMKYEQNLYLASSTKGFGKLYGPSIVQITNRQTHRTIMGDLEDSDHLKKRHDWLVSVLTPSK